MGLPERLAEKWTGAYRVHSTRFVTDAVREAVREALDQAAKVARTVVLDYGYARGLADDAAAAIERLKEA